MSGVDPFTAYSPKVRSLFYPSGGLRLLETPGRLQDPHPRGNEFDGPAVITVFTTCQPEHGVADHMAAHQAKLAMESRAFPIFIHDPRAGSRLKERIDLKGNPAVKEDWYTIRKTGETIDFLSFARSEGRFAKHFDSQGNPSETILAAQEDRLENWRMLQEMAGVI